MTFAIRIRNFGVQPSTKEDTTMNGHPMESTDAAATSVPPTINPMISDYNNNNEAAAVESSKDGNEPVNGKVMKSMGVAMESAAAAMQNTDVARENNTDASSLEPAANPSGSSNKATYTVESSKDGDDPVNELAMESTVGVAMESPGATSQYDTEVNPTSDSTRDGAAVAPKATLVDMTGSYIEETLIDLTKSSSTEVESTALEETNRGASEKQPAEEMSEEKEPATTSRPKETKRTQE
jgi:hypothetical protein